MREAVPLAAGLAAIAAASYVYVTWMPIANAATVSTTFLLIVLLVRGSTFRVAVASRSRRCWRSTTSFCRRSERSPLPIRRTGWRCSRSSPSAWSRATSRRSRERGRGGARRRDELARLFDLSRDVSDERQPRCNDGWRASIARRFDLGTSAIALPAATRGTVRGRPAARARSPTQLSAHSPAAQSALEFDATQRTYAGHRTHRGGRHVRLVPLRSARSRSACWRRPGGRSSPARSTRWPASLRIAIERAQLLEERKAAS